MSESKSKVYVIQKVLRKQPDGSFRGLDFSQAERFGEVIFLFDGYKQVVMSPQPTIRKIKQILKHFNDNDYLVLVGDPALIGLTCSVASTISNGRYNMLKYDRIERDYFPIRVDINE
tara:strand:- start:7133 stop:7483 length:351 start_codon:yes stop_codon:yes gene_type:complete